MIRKFRAAVAAGLLAVSLATPAFSAENGTGFYLLGARGDGAGFTPPPGWYFSKVFYYYSGSTGGNVALPTGGKFSVGVEANAFFVAPTVLWIAPEEILGGRFGLSLATPAGSVTSKADATLTGALLGRREASVEDDLTTYGDPVLGGLLGWDAGNFHYQVGTSVNVPIGDYHDGGISQLSFNRWAADIYGAVTWFDPALGWDVSNTLGVTFNGQNPATDYRTGTELHWEGAVTRHLTKQFKAGINGYFYQQLTADGGDGAELGAFKGRVAAIGGSVGYNFEFGKTPVATELKVFHEFAAENRAEGNSIFATISLPF